MIATVPEPRKLYVVIHPGGSADVAHKENDWMEPRQLVLKNKPVELSSAVIQMDVDTIPAHRAAPLPPNVYKFHNPIYGMEEDEEPPLPSQRAQALESPTISSGSEGSGSGWSEAAESVAASVEVRVIPDITASGECSGDTTMQSQGDSRQ